MTSDTAPALCQACGFAIHPDNEVVQAVTVRQGGPHNKPVVIRGEREVMFHDACWGAGAGGFEASDRGTFQDVQTRN